MVNDREVEEEKRNSKDQDKFYARPSLGLRLWGPLVPASDNKGGLWTLVGLQTAMGLFCLSRFRAMGKKVVLGSDGLQMFTNIANKKVSDIPTLNRFANGIEKQNSNVLGNRKFIPGDNGSRNRFPRWHTFARVAYLLTGSLILSQSALEACRLSILKYDPWCEEAKMVREKKFFNDIIKFYHEGVDPEKVKVKDAISGQIMPNNIPEVKQSVALVRAQAEAQNPITKWFGPIDYRPMSFGEYLDKVEYFMDMFDYVEGKRRIMHGSAKKADSNLSKSSIDETRRKIIERLSMEPPRSEEQAQTARDEQSKGSIALRGLLLDDSVKSAQDVDLTQVWSIYDPWMNLALETSLSIKFIPTVSNPDESNREVSGETTNDDRD